MRGIVLFFLLSGMLTACGKDGAGNDQLKPQNLHIVTTIKPLQAIVTAITSDVAQSYQLIPDYESPHDYNFKPSDIRNVKQANVIFRIDASLEIMLNPLFENLSKETKLVSLADIDGINLLGVATRRNNEEEHDSDSDDKHGHSNIDYHIWTSPRNAIVMASSIAATLTQLDPHNKTQYEENLKNFVQKIEAESTKISKELASRRNKPYIVFHDSWQYFAQEFQLQKPVVVSLHEGLSPGAKTLSEIRKKIIGGKIGCIFTSPNISTEKIRPLLGLEKSNR
jgi:zinc transport system substrate-binding protein